MVGFRSCPRCGGQFCEHQLGAGAVAPGGGIPDPIFNAAHPSRPERTPRQELADRAGALFDALDALVAYRVHQNFSRDRREREKVADLKERFQLAMLSFSRELGRQLLRAVRAPRRGAAAPRTNPR